MTSLPVRSDSATLIANISSPGQTKLHPDFGGDGAYGIPFMVVPATQPKVPINYTAYGDESDPGPFPIPANAPVEGGSASDGDRHVLVVQQGTCHLYELGRAFWRGNHWNADVGVNWNLSSNALRPLGWTSADAAGLPILPGLVRYDEVAAGHIDHAVRFTVPRHADGIHLPGDALRVVVDERGAAADGAAVAVEGELLARRLPRRVARDPAGAEDVRDDRRRQRIVVVHHRRGRHALERRRPEPAEDGARAPRSKRSTPGAIHH